MIVDAMNVWFNEEFKMLLVGVVAKPSFERMCGYKNLPGAFDAAQNCVWPVLSARWGLGITWDPTKTLNLLVMTLAKSNSNPL